MKRYAFELSGEHETLPRCEALALVEIYSERYREWAYLDQCLIVDAEGLDVQALGKRLAMTHRIIEVMAVCEADPEDLSRSVALLSLPDKSYRVRAKRIKNASPGADAVEHEIGKVLFGRLSGGPEKAGAELEGDHHQREDRPGDGSGKGGSQLL